MKIDFRKRIDAITELIEHAGIDALFVTRDIHVFYASGFPGAGCMLLISERKRFFITDSRYIEEARDSVTGFDIIAIEESAFETVKALAKKYHFRKIGFESAHLSFDAADRFRKTLGAIKVVATPHIIERLRVVKEAPEIELIEKSVKLTKRVLTTVLRSARPGATERSLSKKIEMEFLNNDSRPGFEPIVAIGKNSSKPHAHPSDAAIRKNMPVMFDLGCTLMGYNSDMTRMLFFGRVERKMQEIYAIVRSAQERAIAQVKPGAMTSDVDHAARGYIEKKGYGRFFGHALGHGLGLEVHEQPTISGLHTEALRPGMVFTIEPAIYLPKVGGVRIEDVVCVTNNGCRILSH